jgi:WD40 repeat protein
MHRPRIKTMRRVLTLFAVMAFFACPISAQDGSPSPVGKTGTQETLSLVTAMAPSKNKIAQVDYTGLRGVIASGSWDKTVRLWRASGGKHLRILRGHTDWVNSVTFSPDGQTIASGSVDSTIRLGRASDGKHLRTLKGHTDSVRSVTFSPDGQIIASAS